MRLAHELFCERRKEPRGPPKGKGDDMHPYSVSLKNEANLWCDEKKHKGVLQNLTISGAQLITHAPFDAGDVLELTIQFPDSIPRHISVQIVYSDKTKEADTNRFGVRFIEIAPHIQEMITWYLYEKIQELYPRQLREMYPPSTRMGPMGVESRSPAPVV